MLSPNCGRRRHGLAPDMVVVHYTAMETSQAAIERLCDPVAEVSAHYVIAEDGAVTQLVDEADRAWHAGAGCWGNVDDVNSHSIGIELANKGPDSDTPEFPNAQVCALETLLAGILERHSISPERVIGHSDMAPGRKIDPGPCFDWKRLAEKGLSVWVEAECCEPDEGVFRTAAREFGFRPADETDESWLVVLDAFRLRFRPQARGVLDGLDTALMVELSTKWPCQAVDLGSPKTVS